MKELFRNNTAKNRFYHSTKLTELMPQTFLQLRMDYKLILESQYLTARICEIAKRPLEIGFAYAGKVETTQLENQTNTIITLDDIFIPKCQKVTATTFEFEQNVLQTYAKEIEKEDKEIVGQGHSHNTMPVFHSPDDRDNYNRMTMFIGVSIEPHTSDYIAKKTQVYETFSNRLQKTYTNIVEKYIHAKPKREMVLPTLIFNTQGHIAQGLARHNFKECRVMEDFPIQYYNKQAVLTQDDKNRLDKKIYAILKHNEIPFAYDMQRLPVKSIVESEPYATKPFMRQALPGFS